MKKDENKGKDITNVKKGDTIVHDTNNKRYEVLDIISKTKLKVTDADGNVKVVAPYYYHIDNSLSEFINDDMGLINGNVPNVDGKISARKTTDQTVKAVTQPFMYGAYRRYYLSEKELPHTSKADELKDNPKKFHEYLKEINEENSFEDYFKEIKTPKDKLKEISRVKAYEVIEQIFDKNKVKDADLLQKQTLPTIDEIKEKETLLLDKLTKIAEYVKNEMSEQEKKVILDYFKNHINNG